MPFRKVENCNQVIRIGKQLKFSLVNVAGHDVVQGNKKLILGNVLYLKQLLELRSYIIHGCYIFMLPYSFSVCMSLFFMHEVVIMLLKFVSLILLPFIYFSDAVQLLYPVSYCPYDIWLHCVKTCSSRQMNFYNVSSFTSGLFFVFLIWVN